MLTILSLRYSLMALVGDIGEYSPWGNLCHLLTINGQYTSFLLYIGITLFSSCWFDMRRGDIGAGISPTNSTVLLL